MGIAFGILVLVLLILALWNRRKSDKAWIKEERYDESGVWIDKRAGERGTYGSLDAEMERERLYVSRINRINDLARLIRDFAFEHVEGFHLRSDAEIKNYLLFAKRQAEQCVLAAEQALQSPKPTVDSATPEEPAAQLAKNIRAFLFQAYPELLGLDLDVLRALDAEIAKIAAACLKA
jgi:hypothetical protein